MNESTDQDHKADVDHCADPYFSEYDILIANGPVDERMFAEIQARISAHEVRDKVLLILVTYGGLANHAYRIGRYLQTVYDDFDIFVPSFCKSAGTLVACAANRIIMSGWGEVGPLDVQLRKQDELFGSRSGLTMRSALTDLKDHALELFEHFAINIVSRSGGAISFKLASEIAAKAASDMMSTIYCQISPVALGQDFRDLNVASAYSERLNRKYSNVKLSGIQKLVHEYPSHDFVIDAEEAQQIFERVETPSPALSEYYATNALLLGRPLSDSLFVALVNGRSKNEVTSRANADEEAPSEPYCSTGAERAGNGAQSPAG